MRNAKITYAILASHRSGSALICNLLAQTEVAGKPNEYFTHWDISETVPEIGDYLEYIEHIIVRTQTPNGVFGVKVMTGEIGGFRGLCQRLETFPSYVGQSDAEKIRTLFPNMKFIYLARRNKVEQAISWWKAVQNEHYHTHENAPMPETELNYNFDAITRLLQELTMEECAHQEFLTMMGVMPMTIIYEDYILDMEGTVARIMDFLGIEDEYTFQAPTLSKMADALTQEWAQRYREEFQTDWQYKRW